MSSGNTKAGAREQKGRSRISGYHGTNIFLEAASREEGHHVGIAEEDGDDGGILISNHMEPLFSDPSSKVIAIISEIGYPLTSSVPSSPMITLRELMAC